MSKLSTNCILVYTDWRVLSLILLLCFSIIYKLLIYLMYKSTITGDSKSSEFVSYWVTGFHVMQQRVYKKVDKYSWQKKNDHTSVEITYGRDNSSKAVKHFCIQRCQLHILTFFCWMFYANIMWKLKVEDNRKLCKE